MFFGGFGGFGGFQGFWGIPPRGTPPWSPSRTLEEVPVAFRLFVGDRLPFGYTISVLEVTTLSHHIALRIGICQSLPVAIPEELSYIPGGLAPTTK